jgi:hypothetical protein
MRLAKIDIMFYLTNDFFINSKGVLVRSNASVGYADVRVEGFRKAVIRGNPRITILL